jgi:hypothetical protein
MNRKAKAVGDNDISLKQLSYQGSKQNEFLQTSELDRQTIHMVDKEELDV